MSERPTEQFPPVREPPVNHRRAWRYVLVAAVTVLVLLLPVAAYLILRDDDGGAPAPGDAAPSAVPVPSVSTSSSVPSSPATTVPDGRISLETLKNSTLTIPAWPADNVQGPSGRLRFRDGVVRISAPGPAEQGRPPTGTEIVLLGAVYGDVDRDGATETVAEFVCAIEGGSKQLVAFDRDSAGHIVTVGRVVATTGEIRDLQDGSVRVGAGGVITVRLGDYQRCCDDQTPQLWQERGYQRSGDRFVQVSGPTRMGANPHVTETSVTAGELVLGPVTGGYRYGTTTVTVRHGWGTPPRQILLHFYPGAGLEPAGSAWPPIITSRSETGFQVSVAPPSASGVARYTFAFRLPPAVSRSTLEVEVSGATAVGTALSEANPFNNGTAVTVRTAD
ncbi:hypothetical protein [Paractinoplanes durhamensis]|uniref:Uncharacterized protein n=1 Tax=Paractinoplanes durhamensis TaxID=113563 RepID=A0ABQ3YRJ4_9ACTN|nr:hypothetical protein [Actinoplanes durhamensis]GIE00218.1 hypothetical protein Adu01nite_15680 [Actinoplanes durhamensis]